MIAVEDPIALKKQVGCPREQFDRGFEDHWRRQVHLGHELTPTERLPWLEQTMEELRPLVGLARPAP